MAYMIPNLNTMHAYCAHEIIKQYMYTRLHDYTQLDYKFISVLLGSSATYSNPCVCVAFTTTTGATMLSMVISSISSVISHAYVAVWHLLQGQK